MIPYESYKIDFHIKSSNLIIFSKNILTFWIETILKTFFEY